MATAKREFKNLTQVPDIVTWPETHYVFIEKIGPFQIPLLQLGRTCISSFPGFRNTTTSPGT